MDRHAGAFFRIPVLPLGGVEGAGPVGVRHRHHLLNGQLVFAGKGKIALVVRGHAHDGAIAIGHEHIVAHPHIDLLTRQGVGHLQARGHAFFFFERQLGFGGAAFLAFFNEGRELGL